MKVLARIDEDKFLGKSVNYKPKSFITLLSDLNVKLNMLSLLVAIG